MPVPSPAPPYRRRSPRHSVHFLLQKCPRRSPEHFDAALVCHGRWWRLDRRDAHAENVPGLFFCPSCWMQRAPFYDDSIPVSHLRWQGGYHGSIEIKKRHETGRKHKDCPVTQALSLRCSDWWGTQASQNRQHGWRLREFARSRMGTGIIDRSRGLSTVIGGVGRRGVGRSRVRIS